MWYSFDPRPGKFHIPWAQSKKKKRKETLTHATAWGKLEDVILRELSQSQKDKSV